MSAEPRRSEKAPPSAGVKLGSRVSAEAVVTRLSFIIVLIMRARLPSPREPVGTIVVRLK